MTQYEVTLKAEQVKELLVRDEGLRELVEEIVNQILEAQMSEQIGAERYERSPERKSYRNGHRVRRLSTRVGPLVLRVPQTREGSFSTDLFGRYQRSEQALVLAMMEMVIQGVSTRKVSAITEELCGSSFSKSTVSQLCTELQVRVDAWNERGLEEKSFPFLIVDAMVIRVRRDGAVRSTSVLNVLGVDEDGYRQILGMEVGDSESEASWEQMFVWLKSRGLKGVDFVVSDHHEGLKNAIERHFQGAVWQRCQVHLMRNVLGLTSKHLKARMTAGVRRIFRAAEASEARQAFQALVAELAGKANRALEVLENGLEDAIAVMALPEGYRRRLRSNNMVERLQQEIRRRERVIRIFPNQDSALRLIGSLLAEQHEAWSTGKRYFNMEEYFSWKNQRLEQPLEEQPGRGHIYSTFRT